MTDSRLRVWGYWTRAKLQMLADYLARFAAASQSQSERVYLDAFAGEGSGVDRLTGEEFNGSARIALEAHEGSGFTKYRYFELTETRARELERRLQEDYPGRDIKVYPGDSNTTIPQALEDLRSLKWAPTFAFLDPDGMELEWSTITALAEHKRGYRAAGSSKPEYKVEIWMLFPSAGLMRTLALDQTKLSHADEEKASRLFGSDDWRAIYDARTTGEITPTEAREEYVNLMRWRLEQDLGYRFTHAFELKNTIGSPVYHMIFATDNDAGTRIMAAIYAKTAAQIPAMQQEAKDRKSGQGVLDFGSPLVGSDATYEHAPPWEPRS
jgi:three-Cys-motif partner protein